MPLEQDVKLSPGILGQGLRPHRDHFPTLLAIFIQAAFEFFFLIVVNGYFFEGIFPLRHGFGPLLPVLSDRNNLETNLSFARKLLHNFIFVSRICWFIANWAVGRIDWLVPRRAPRLIALGRDAQAWLLRFLPRCNLFIEQVFGLGLMVP